MKKVSVTKLGFSKLKSHQIELKSQDFEDSTRSLTPGEWISIPVEQDFYVGFINPQVDEKKVCFYLVDKEKNISGYSPENAIIQKIRKAREYRKSFNSFSSGRIFYGQSDGLSGLIIDEYENAIIVQINTAGIDKFREIIKNELNTLSSKSVFLLDNPKYRENESLPIYSSEKIPDLSLIENNLKYQVQSISLQKVGFYFDHRDNRKTLDALLRSFSKSFNNGLDLFSYVGAWGITALNARVKKMTFVDQGDFTSNIHENLKLNNFVEQGQFIRSDVFKFLDQLIESKASIDIILSDPPAFAKSLTQKKQAIDGYTKLHRKILKLISSGGLVCFSSCTHYVSDDEFQKTILESSFKENRKLRLVSVGHQGFDHPVVSKLDRSNYIKSYFYIVE